jgi:predicted small lipoprotein YifL
MRIVAVLLTAASAALLAGCGQKGPLYLPEKNAAVVTAPAASGASAAPAAPAAPAGTAAPATPPPQSAPAPGVAAPSAPAPQKKQNGDDESQK